MTYTLDWSDTNLGGSAVVSYDRGAVLDFTDKPAGATAALSLAGRRADGTNVILAEFSIETTGSSVLTFDYHTSTEATYDKLHIDVDGVSQAEYSGTVAWTSHAGINIASAGVHTIRFRYQKDGSGLGGSDRVWVALVNVTNTVTVNDDSSTVDTYDMEDAAIPSVVTTTDWTNSTSAPITGTRSLRSPASPANNGSYDLTVTKPASAADYSVVSFDYKTSTEAGWDKLYVFPDSTAANVPGSGHPSTSGGYGWLDFSGTSSGHIGLILPSAESSFLLRYAKDGGSSAGSDAVWIDTLKMPAAGGATNYNGTTTAASTATTTSTGVVGKVATAALAATVAVSAVGVVGKSASTTITETATTSATGVVGKSTGSTSSNTATTAATGVVGKVATSSLASTVTVTAAGTVVSGASASTTLAATGTTTAAGVVGRAATSSLASTGTIAATGLVEVPGAATATVASTGTITTAGQVAATSLASITAAAEMLAAGAVGVTRTTTLASTASVTAAGVVIDPGAIAATPAARTIVIPAETRVLVVPAENRTLEA